MALIAVIATTFTTTGIPTTTSGWVILGITVFGTLLVYLAKNYFMPSTSATNTIDLKDILSGLILAIGTALTSFTASLVTGTAISWTNVLHLVLTASGAYLATKFGFGKTEVTTAVAPVITPIPPIPAQSAQSSPTPIPAPVPVIPAQPVPMPTTAPTPVQPTQTVQTPPEGPGTIPTQQGPGN